MAKKVGGISISIEEETLERFDAIREAIAEQNEFGIAPNRSMIIEGYVEKWNEENAHYLEE